MENKLYEIKTLENGFKVLSILPINNTGIAEAYCTLKCNEMGHSEGPSGPFSANIYKKLYLENSIKDFKLACESLNIPLETVVTNRLIYFTDIVRYVDKSDLENYDIFDEPNAPHADGLITDSKEITLFNYAADCAIIMFADPKYKIVGSLHAAWKGTLGGIIENEIEKFKEKTNNDISNLIAVHMPCISQEMFEVGEDVATTFIEKGWDKYVDTSSYTKPHIDLMGINKSILLNCGLKPENVFTMNDLCTYKNEEFFHSFRRGPVDEKGVHHNGMNGYFIKLL